MALLTTALYYFCDRESNDGFLSAEICTDWEMSGNGLGAKSEASRRNNFVIVQIAPKNWPSHQTFITSV